jgi:glyoxylase-like metal-dependent hydrolase (beta-lactamase superfamily II)
MTMHKLLAGSAAALTFIAGAAFAQAPAPTAPAPQAPMVVKTLKPNVYMIVGNGGNSTVVVGPTGVVLVDTKNPGEAVYQELIGKIASVTPLPVEEVLFTHHHADHSGNALLFMNHGIQSVGHQGEASALQTYVPAGNPTPRPIAPSVTYNDELTLHAGGVTAEAHHWGEGHTGGDTVVYFPAQKIVAGGDEVVSITPNIDYAFGGSIKGWLKSLDAIAKLDFDYIVPGHGDNALTKADFLAYKKKWETFAERARAVVKAGTPKDKMMAAIKTDDLGWTVNTPLWNQPARLDGMYAELSK